MIRETITSVPVMLCLTVGAYLLGCWVKKKSALSLLHPFLISIPVIIAILWCLDIPCSVYLESNQLITFLLGPCVVSLGLMLYEHRKTIKQYCFSILVTVFVGSVVGVGSVWALCELFKLDDVFFDSLAAKSVTTPIAMDLTSMLGGNVSLAAISVVLCGFSGAIVGPLVLRWAKIKAPVAKGLAMGCASHGLGTARAVEMGAIEGAVGGLSIALMGLATSLVVSVI